MNNFAIINLARQAARGLAGCNKSAPAEFVIVHTMQRAGSFYYLAEFSWPAGELDGGRAVCCGAAAAAAAAKVDMQRDRQSHDRRA